MTSRRDFLKRGSLYVAASALAVAGVEALDPERVGWVRRLWPGWSKPQEIPAGVFVSNADGHEWGVWDNQNRCLWITISGEWKVVTYQ